MTVQWLCYLFNSNHFPFINRKLRINMQRKQGGRNTQPNLARCQLSTNIASRFLVVRSVSLPYRNSKYLWCNREYLWGAAHLGYTDAQQVYELPIPSTARYFFSEKKLWTRYERPTIGYTSGRRSFYSKLLSVYSLVIEYGSNIHHRAAEHVLFSS